ncbi:SCO3374 family protein [Streptomyces sp. NPDC092369]|uniref:SCO3374 family protein n=1 Tax=Streptomyces sp. NPDC092369 TaxID=3366015 RepID=UPI003812155B
MVGSDAPLTRPLTAVRTTVPPPRRPVDQGGPDDPRNPLDRLRRWYEDELGWPTEAACPDSPLRLSVGVRFDVLDVPAEAGRAALRHLVPGSPVAVQGDRMRLLVAAGGAEELPGLLDWLEWRALALDLTAIGEGGRMEAPLPPARVPVRADALQGAAMWLRPPEPGCEVETSLPTLSAVGGLGGAPDLARLVDTLATQCHRLRLRRACAQPPSFP